MTFFKVGFFSFKEKEQVKVVREDDSGQKDVIQCGYPVELITTLLKKLGGAATVNQLCQVTHDRNVTGLMTSQEQKFILKLKCKMFTSMCCDW